jgi:hypothetical protein
LAGFVLESVTSEGGFGDQLKLVDLGDCEILRGYQFGRVRAGWARWAGSRQLWVRESPNGVFLIEGEPDRLPRINERARDWLPGRTGSFRGFEIERQNEAAPARVCAFVDPLGTRPIFLLRRGHRVLFADKLATIAVNAHGLECAWPELLEACVLGTLFSLGTTVVGAHQLLPGERLDINGNEIALRNGATYPLGPAPEPQPDAAVRLGEALRTAIAETWTDPECRLLLSGGLDSRLLLGLAEGRRKALTLDWYPEETLITQRVAAACEADLKLLPFREDDYCVRMQYGYLVTAGVQQSPLVNNLGMALAWRRSGISAVTHGYFHNSIFRGWTAGPWQRYPDLKTPLAQYMGTRAHYFDKFNDFPHRLQKAALGLISSEGRRLLQTQLKALADSIEPVIVDGFDLTFERLIMKQVARQIYFGIFLGWLEEIDVASPVFQAAAWRWYASTHPADRHHDRAVIELYQMIGRGLADIPDFSSGKAVGAETAEAAQAWRNQFWFPAARAIARTARRFRAAPPPMIRSGRDWDQVYRQPAIANALLEGLDGLKNNPLFDWGAISAERDGFLVGERKSSAVLWMLAKAGQWRKFVDAGGDEHPAVRHIAETAPLDPLPASAGR